MKTIPRFVWGQPTYFGTKKGHNLGYMSLQSLTLLPRYMGPSTWWQHVPIGHWLIAELKPRKVVELGSHYGVSLFAFCEAAEVFSPKSFIYGIDTWAGDAHSGKYEQDVYAVVHKHWSSFHKLRARLVRSTFDEALDHFPKDSIDLLHIDGLHTYDAVKHDFELWQPKMSNKSAILLHDINVRERKFGVWKLWEEIKSNEEFSSIEIMNGHGLGIIFKGETLKSSRDMLNELLPLLTSKGVLLDNLAKATPEGNFKATNKRSQV